MIVIPALIKCDDPPIFEACKRITACSLWQSYNGDCCRFARNIVFVGWSYSVPPHAGRADLTVMWTCW